MEPQTPMPRVKRYVYIALALAAIAIFTYLLSTGLLDSQSGVVIILRSLLVTIVVIEIVEWPPEIVRWLTFYSRQGKFIRFFGPAVFEGGVKLVYPFRELAEDRTKGAWKTHYHPPIREADYPTPNVDGSCLARIDRMLRRNKPEIPTPEAEGVNAWLAFQEIRAAVYIANAVFPMTHRGLSFCHDRDVSGGNVGFCAIAMGLGFNGFTHDLVRICNDDNFKIKWDILPNSDFPELTDQIWFKGSLLVPSNTKDYCIIARVVLPPVPGSPIPVNFICAGRTAQGTAVAGYFLANNWEKLMQLYKDEKKDLNDDSMVTVIQHTICEPGYEQEFDSTGQIVTDGVKVEWMNVRGPK